MADDVSVDEEAQAYLDKMNAEAVEVEPIYAVGHVLGLGAYAPAGEIPGEDDLQVALVLLAYDPASESIIRLPILFDPEYAVRAGFVTQETLDTQRAEVASQLAEEAK